MRALFIHSDYIEYEAKRKTKVAEDIGDDEKKRRVEEVLAVFISFEKADEGKETESAQALVENVVEIVQKVEAERIVLYPYAHLSSSLAKPDTCIKILHTSEDMLKKQGFEVYTSPFGWYKSFELSCKGHPLSELSREIVAGEAKEEDVSEAVKAEETISSTWMILDGDGSEHALTLESNKVKGYDFGGLVNLRKFCQYEMAKSKVSKGEPAHVDMMRRLELVDYEPGSDPGNFRYYPKGKLVKGLLEDYVTDSVKQTGGMEIESPIMYDFEHPSLKEYVNRFPARQYTIQTPDKKVFLRFAACFGQFLMMHDATISYRNLPMRLFEMSRYSFRAEQRGELTGLRRLRAFTMPDCHSFCMDMDMAKSEIVSRFDLSWDILQRIGFEIPDGLEFAVRATRDFYDENKAFIIDLVKKWGKPALVEIWSDRFFYFVFKYEWNFVDALDKASALNTDQIDVENAERYGITYVGSDGQKHHPLILHQSPSGAIERLIYALLERENLRGMQGIKPQLPYWLSPTQVRFIPVKDEFVDYCIALAEQLPGRVDVDDRDMTVGKKIRDAEREWIPFIIVFGEKEKEGGKLQVRLRGEEDGEMDIKSLITEMKERQGDMPTSQLPLPMQMSKRVIFRG